MRLAERVGNQLPAIAAPRVSGALSSGVGARLHEPVKRRARTGGWLIGDYGDVHFEEFARCGQYDWRNVAALTALVRPGDTVIEVGANVGTETVSLVDIVGTRGRVHVFEPVPVNCRTLHENLSQPGWANVQLYEVAVSDEEGTATFVLPPEEQSGIGHLSDGNVHGTSISVPTVALDSLRQQFGPVSLLYCDTEGLETRVIRGASQLLRESRPAVILEACPKTLRRAGSSIDELLNMIVSLNYVAYEISSFNLIQLSSDDVIRESRLKNWLCLPYESRHRLARAARGAISRAAVLPPLLGVDPFSLIRRRNGSTWRRVGGN